jgi:hypothetical protein
VSAVKLIEARDAEAGPFRKAMLSLTCRDKTTGWLQYVHEVGAGAEGLPAGLRVIAGGRGFPLTRLGVAAQDGNRPRVENHGAELPLAALAEAAFVIETAQPSEGTADKAARGPVRLTVAAGPALGVLVRRCNSDVRQAGGAPR